MKFNVFKSIIFIITLLTFQCHAAGLLVPATKVIEMQNSNYNIDISKNSSIDSMIINVSKDPLDSIGENEKLFSTIGQAQEYIRLLKKDGMFPPKGVTVMIHDNIEFLTEGVHFSAEDSGTADGPVVYKGSGDNKASLSGALSFDVSDMNKVEEPSVYARLNSGSADKIRQINLESLGVDDCGELNVFGMGAAYFSYAGVDCPSKPVPEVFFNNEPMTLGRYPNDDWLHINEVIDPGDDVEMWWDNNKTLSGYVPHSERTYPPKPSIFSLDSETTARATTWGTENDIWIYGYFKEYWSDVSLPVNTINSDVVTTDLPSPKKMQANKPFYFYNILSEVDSPGEYYIDREKGILYFYPPGEEGTVSLSLLETPVIKADDVSHIHFEDLNLSMTRGTVAEINNSYNIVFKNCIIKNTAKHGVIFTDCKSSGIDGCEITKTGTGGVSFSTSDSKHLRWLRNTLSGQKNFARNSHIHDYSRIRKTYSSAVSLSGNGITVSNNVIHGSDHMAISLSGNDHIIEYNEFYDILRSTNDAGAIYGGFNKEQRGIVIRHNYFHDIATDRSGGTAISAIYMDDLRDGCTVESNLFVNFKGMIFYVNGGRDNIFRNNIAVNSNKLFHLNASGLSPGNANKYDRSRYSFEKYTSNPEYNKYPHFAELENDTWNAPKYNVFEQNVRINCSSDYTFGQMSGTTEEQMLKDNTIKNSYIITDESIVGFDDFTNGNYRLSDSSIIYVKYPDFVPADFENIGIKE